MFKIYRLVDTRIGECVGNPLLFMSDAEASMWLDSKKLHPDLVLHQVGKINGLTVESCDVREIPVNAYAFDLDEGDE